MDSIIISCIISSSSTPTTCTNKKKNWNCRRHHYHPSKINSRYYLFCCYCIIFHFSFFRREVEGFTIKTTRRKMMTQQWPIYTQLNSSNDDDVVIVSACRTPLCRAKKGGFAKVPAATLFQTVLEEVMVRAGPTGRISHKDVDDVCVGNVLLPPAGFAVLRMAQLSAGFPDSCSLSTTNRQCASGLQAVANIAQSIQAGHIKIGIAAGVESMSSHQMPNNLSPNVIDWNKMKPEAMDCLLPMGVSLGCFL